MFAARSQLRSAAGPLRLPRQRLSGSGARFQSTRAASSGTPMTNFAAGIAGGVVASGVLYFAYSMTPAGQVSSKVNKTAREINKKYKQAAQKLQDSPPDADKAVEWIKDFCYSYVSWIPGGRAYVDTAFRDYYTIRDKHNDEVKEIVEDGYGQLRDLAKSGSGLSMETATKTYEILADVAEKMASLAGDAAGDLLDNHPELKEKYGDSVEQLKQLGEQYGPEAKKQMDETWTSVKEIVAGGLTAANADKLQKLLQERLQEMRKFGEKAWNDALDKAQPILDKSPEVKSLIQDNADKLKLGNVQDLFSRAKKAVESGNIEDFQTYIKDTISKSGKKAAGKLSGGFDASRLLDKLPQAQEIQPKLQQLIQVAKDNAGEGEKLLKETLEELKTVIEQKSKEAEKLVSKARQQAK